MALAECTFTGPETAECVGAAIELSDTLRPDALLFGESTGRVLVTTSEPGRLLALAAKAGVPAREIGETGGDRLRIAPPGESPWIDLPIERLKTLWRAALPRRLEAA